MKNKLIIVAKIEAKTEHIDFVKKELIKLIKPTLAENGCIQYELHQDNTNPEIFLFYETWENKQVWQTHMQNTHLTEYMGATDGKVENFTLNEMTKF
jgi:quinol monooxygenase YgiN